jgi:5-methylcytosine-specific restriction protein A
MCSAQGRTIIATVADHIIPHEGDEALFWQGALQSLCAPCHSSRKQTQELVGYSSEVDKDGWPIDERHPFYPKGQKTSA